MKETCFKCCFKDATITMEKEPVHLDICRTRSLSCSSSSGSESDAEEWKTNSEREWGRREAGLGGEEDASVMAKASRVCVPWSRWRCWLKVVAVVGGLLFMSTCAIFIAYMYKVKHTPGEHVYLCQAEDGAYT